MRQKIKQTFYAPQSGQALVFGLMGLCLVMLMCGYFLFCAEALHRNYTSVAYIEKTALQLRSNEAHVLNAIAINNQNILMGLQTSQKALVKATEMGISLSYKQPYWLAMKKGEKTDLSQEVRDDISRYESVGAAVSARGLWIAKTLADKNQILVRQLPLALRRYMHTSSAAMAHCLALSLLPDTTEKVFLNQSFGFDKNQATADFGFLTPWMMRVMRDVNTLTSTCKIYQKPSKVAAVLNKLPGIGFQTVDDILFYNDLSKMWSKHKNDEYGVTYVSPAQWSPFIQALKFSIAIPRNPPPHHTAYGQEAMFHTMKKLFALWGNDPVTTTLMSTTYSTQRPLVTGTVAITHGGLHCGHNARGTKVFSSLEAWSHLSGCQINKNDFLHVFFKPQWTAIVLDTKEDRSQW